MKEYIHKYRHILECELKRVKGSTISKENKKLILAYYAFDLSNGLSVPRLVRKVSILRIVAERYGIEYSRATKEDYVRVIADLKGKELANGTVWVYKKVLRVFHKWLNGGEQYPECVKWFKFKEPNKNTLPEGLLTQEDVKRLIQVSGFIRDKAFISCLWESGARIGEIGTVKIKNVSFDEYGCKVLVDGKTGMRKIRLVHAAPFLLEWINRHPFNGDHNAPMWVGVRRDYGHQLDYATLRKLLRKAAKRASIKKPVNPHNFRHSRATYLAQFLTEAQMKEFFGWTQDSRMAARYIHLSGKQVDDALLRVYGLKKEEKKEDILKPVTCPRCKHLNSPNNEYCEKCWLPLTQKAQVEAIQTRDLSDQSSVVLMQLVDLAKTLSQANPRKVQETLSAIQRELGQGVVR